MAAPEGHRHVKPFNPPGWMRDGALKAVKQMSSDQIAAKLQKATEDAHNSPAAARQTLAELIPVRERPIPIQPSIFQQPQPRDDGELEPVTQQQHRVEQAQSFFQTSGPKVLQVQNRDERRAKKVASRKDQTTPQKDKSKTSKTSRTSRTSKTSSPIDATSLSSMAESSNTGAQREAITASNEPMEVDSSASLFVPDEQDGYTVLMDLPKWYTTITEASFIMKELSKKGAPALKDLDILKLSIGACEASKMPDPTLYNKLRSVIHKTDIDSKVDQYIIKKSRILSCQFGLPRIFKTGTDFPSDIKADAFQLYNRWINEDFDQDLLRGIYTKKGDKRNGDALQLNRIKAHRKNAKYFGAGNLVLGQWWPTQLSTLRDGAHGATQGGIFGEPDKGAYSIVLSGGCSYDDTDDGNVIEYSGTASKTDTPTAVTAALIKSVELGNQIRVIRSAQLPMKNKFRPAVGLRYDGLYVAVSYKLVDKTTQMHRFRLERCARQAPIRCEGVARRPTREEERAFEALKVKFWR